MTIATFEPTPVLVVAADESTETAELVRGQDKQLLDRVMPLVNRQSVSLDLASIERIDAAGIAALVTLYATACQAGHKFTVSNASPRVAHVLALVGLDRYLLAHNAAQISHCGPRFCQTAA
jgi:anti-anti-sigma factor